MMATITKGTPYPTIRYFVILLLGSVGILDLNKVRKNYASYWSLWWLIVVAPNVSLPDLSEDVEAHHCHPDEGCQKKVVIYTALKRKYLKRKILLITNN